MANTIKLNQTEGLAQAYRIVENLVLRTNQGKVFTIEVGETLLGSGSAFGGKVTQQGNPPVHIGFCEAASAQEIVQAAERLIVQVPTAARLSA